MYTHTNVYILMHKYANTYIRSSLWAYTSALLSQATNILCSSTKSLCLHVCICLCINTPDSTTNLSIAVYYIKAYEFIPYTQIHTHNCTVPSSTSRAACAKFSSMPRAFLAFIASTVLLLVALCTHVCICICMCVYVNIIANILIYNPNYKNYIYIYIYIYIYAYIYKWIRRFTCRHGCIHGMRR